MIITQRVSPNSEKGPVRPTAIVVHWTGGGTTEGAVEWLCNPASKASAHYVIGRNGAVTQLVNEGHIAWHAGISEWEGRTGCNKFTIGIELVNAGEVWKSGKSFRNKLGVSIQAAQTVQIEDRFYHSYPEEQLNALLTLCRGVMERNPSIVDILGHSDISPGRKADPGPAFPMGWLRSVLEGRQ